MRWASGKSGACWLVLPTAAARFTKCAGWGPEGGGSLTYRIEGKRARKAVEFLVSSDFSPGGSTRPQLVPIAHL